MRQAIITAPWTAELRQVDDPVVTPGQVLIRVRVTGICTLEQRIYRGARTQYPFLGGHEISGTVVEQSSPHFAQGATVAVSAFPRCGSCELCLGGLDNLCGYKNSPPQGSNQLWGPGGLADYVLVPEKSVFPVQASSIAASLVEPLACVLHSLSRARLSRGDQIAIFGFGVMGALHVLAATQLGLEPIWINLPDSSSPSRRLASADIEISDIPAFELRGHLVSKQLRPKAVYCVRGGLEAIRVGGSIVAPGGVLVYFASPFEAMVASVDLRELRTKEATLSVSVNHTLADFAKAARLAAEISDELENVVGACFSLSSINEALTLAVQSDAGRVVVEP